VGDSRQLGYVCDSDNVSDVVLYLKLSHAACIYTVAILHRHETCITPTRVHMHAHVSIYACKHVRIHLLVSGRVGMSILTYGETIILTKIQPFFGVYTHTRTQDIARRHCADTHCQF
jgi:hypothetical protein